MPRVWFFKYLFGLALLCSMLLSGCGVSGGVSDSKAQSSHEQPTEPQEERIIQHVMGETKVPVQPQRVVVLDTGELDSALALGVKPVGAVSAFADGAFPVYLADQTEGIHHVGTIQEPNLEAILALNPDLILSSKLRHEAIYDQLSKIAPTVFTESVGVTWKENFKVHAEALGKTAEYERLMQTYNDRMTEFRTKLGKELSENEVSIVRFLSGQVRIYMNASFIGTVIKDSGLPRPSVQNKDKFMEEGTRERIPDFDGDVLFITSFGPVEKTDLTSYKSDPLWSQLRAVQNDKVYEVDDSYWMLGIGIQAAMKVQDDLFKIFLEGGPSAQR